jgi:hypothetical protein
VARPADNSHLCSCPFRHNTTLQHYRLSSVTTTVTSIFSRAQKRRTPKIHLPRDKPCMLVT